MRHVQTENLGHAGHCPVLSTVSSGQALASTPVLAVPLSHASSLALQPTPSGRADQKPTKQPCCIFGCFWSDRNQGTTPGPQKADGGGSEVPAMGTQNSQDKASRRMLPVLAQRLAMLPWASLLKSYTIQHQSPDLKGVSWSSVHLDTSCSALIYLCDMGDTASNFSLFCCLQGSTMCAVSVQEQPLLVAPERVISLVLSTRESYFPGTSRREPVKSWEYPAFTSRCLWFNKDSWGQTTVLFISSPEKTNENNFSLPAKIFLWQILNFHWKWKHKLLHEN